MNNKILELKSKSPIPKTLKQTNKPQVITGAFLISTLARFKTSLIGRFLGFLPSTKLIFHSGLELYYSQK